MVGEFLIDVLRWSVLILGFFDAYKYKMLSRKIARFKSSREHSRTAINLTISFKSLLLFYSLIHLKDWVVTWTCLIALYTSLETFYNIYLFYPYKTRGLSNFKRPPLGKYIVNSLLPNHIRKRL